MLYTPYKGGCTAAQLAQHLKPLSKPRRYTYTNEQGRTRTFDLSKRRERIEIKPHGQLRQVWTLIGPRSGVAL